MKKIGINCIFILFVVSMAFIGCAKKDSGKKVLELWHIQTADPMPAIIQASADRFTAANPDFEVRISSIANDSFKQKLAVAMSSNKMPDVFLSWSGGPMEEYARDGTIVDLTPYMNANNYKDKYLDAGIAQATYQGKIWGVPVENVAICMVYYNKELFSKYGLNVPATVADLEKVADTFLKNGISPFSLANKTQWTGSMYFMFLATRHGGTAPFKAALSGDGSFTDPAFVWAGDKIQEWVKKGYFNTGFNGLDEDSGQARQILYKGDAAMLIMGSWFLGQALSESPEFYSKLGLFNFPKDETGVGDARTLIGTVGDNFYHVAASGKYPEKAFELISHLLDDDAVSARIAAGHTPPLKNVHVPDALSQELLNQLEMAPDIQFWYDQSLSPEVSEVHKTTSQEIFGGTKTSLQAAEELEKAQKAYLKK
ncbi:extracellular solute-binding protein [Treponema primitia]|uniref:extracellular solute-binding protein n=1 Tax=Treponema primitia TaxID=88058 RepID=UPI003980DAAD